MNQILRPPLPHMTADDFLAWPGDGSGRKFQLVDGVLHVMSPASPTHSIIQGNLAGAIWSAIDRNNLPLAVAVEGAIVPGLNASANLRVPDLVVTAAQAAVGQAVVPDPIVLIEVLSPGNQDDTRDNVRAYSTLPTVQEMAVVHSTRVLIELHRRDKAGNWPPEPEYLEAGQRLTLATLGLDHPVEAIYRRTWLQA